ncbi:hepatocyte cell adhesion molecule-like [Scyliorhinus canicula]|uniref:hepatocyte cell adhesion molecule-like n=1 Tax=Scyliorhinus canicula TaxID=7830 RepID=UPI0018F5DC9C|nr:hepatocyte cell adhesion molecule-like [Scyliorhinus canicula]
MQKFTMKFSDSFYVHIFKLASVLHLFVVCGETLLARVGAITNAAAGEQFQFPIQYQAWDQYEVTFRLRYPVAFKILTWKSNNPEKLRIVHPLYQHRVGIDRGFVMLNDIHVNDTGEYEIHIDYYGTELKNRDQSTFRIQVFEPVPQPETVILGNCASSSNITLSCSVFNKTNVLIHWEKVSSSGVLPETYNDTVIVIDCVTEEEQHVYRCIAENPVSNATSDQVTVNLHKGSQANSEKLTITYYTATTFYL